MITENKDKRIEDTKEEQKHVKINNKKLLEMLKDLTKALKKILRNYYERVGKHHDHRRLQIQNHRE